MGAVLFCALASLIVSAPTAKTNTDSLLAKMRVASQRVNYQGEKISKAHCGTNCVTAILLVEHAKPSFTKTTFFKPRRLVGTIILRRAASSWRFSPSNSTWVKIATGNPIVPSEDDSIFLNYDISVIGEASVAKHKTIVLQVLPKSCEDLGKRIWVDKEHFIVIKQEAFTRDGRIVYSSQFTRIVFNPKFEHGTFDLPDHIIAQSNPTETFTVISPRYLPKGYARVTNKAVMAGGHRCHHIYFSNGISGISLFQRQLAKGEVLHKTKSTQGANIISWQQYGKEFVLVGDVSVRELERIANSLKP